MIGNVFAAIQFDGETLEALESYRDHLLELAPRTRTTRPDNWHITLAFLGKLTEGESERAVQVLEGFSGAPFEVRIGGFGTFGRGVSKTLWVGVDKSPALADCQRRLQRAYEEEGFLLPPRAFSPHITMCYRWSGKSAVSLDELRAGMPLITARVSQLVLLRTEQNDQRINHYAPLASATLR